MDRTKRTHPRRLLSLLLAWLLCVSCVQPAFAASETAKTVQLMKTEGTVSVTNSSGKSVSQRDNMRLYNGYQVVSDKASYAWFNLDNAKLSKLDEVSGMELRKSGKKLELLLNSGNLFFNVTEPLEEDETLNIRTSTMVVGIRGTCGWVEVIDQWHSRVRVLEGRVTCSVTDPVTGQTKTTVLTGGEWAECVVYPQDRSGDKCDIIRQRFTEEDIPGFALVELVGDGPLCEKIYADSGLDLRSLTQAQAQAKLRADQAAMAEKLGESQRAQEVQERHVSTDPVWEETASDSGNQGDDNGTGSAPSAPAVSPAPADTSGVTSTTPVTTQSLTMTMPVTIPQIQAALNRPNASAVTVVPGTGNNTLTQLGTETLTVDAGKTLTLDPGVDMVVQNPGTVNVNGTMNVNGNLDNYGTINVTSANSLHVSGYFRNHSTGGVNNIESGHIVPAQGIENSGTISTSGNAVLESPAGATVKMMETGAELNLNGGSISNNAGGNAILWTANGGSPGDDITNTDTTSIWTTGSAPLAVENANGTTTDNPALDGYKVVSNDGQTSLRPTGGVEGGVIIDPVTVSFDANGGRWSGNAPSITVERGQPMGAQSQAPTREDYTFVNWQDASGTVYTESTAVTADTTLYAQWRYEGGEPAEESVTVTFDAGDGAWSDGRTEVSITLHKDAGLPFLPEEPGRSGYTFSGWSGLQSAYSADTTITALWTPEQVDMEVVVTFNANGGTLRNGQASAAITIPAGSAAPFFPADPTRSEKMFTGWYDAETGGTQYTESSPFAADTTLYAQWIDSTGTEDPGITVTFDANGGTFSSSGNGKAVFHASDADQLAQLAWPEDPDRDDAYFLGWLPKQFGDISDWNDLLNDPDLNNPDWPDEEPDTYYAVWLAGDTITLPADIPIEILQDILNQTFVKAVDIIEAFDEDATLTIDEDLLIPDGKTLVLMDGVGMSVESGATLTNYGKVYVYYQLGLVRATGGVLEITSGEVCNMGTLSLPVVCYGGEFYMYSGMINNLMQTRGSSYLYGGSLNSAEITGGKMEFGGARLESPPVRSANGGELRVSGKNTEVYISSGQIYQLTVEDGDVRVSGGTIRRVSVDDGELYISGGLIGSDWESPAIRMSGGTVTIEYGAIIRSSSYRGVIDYSGGRLNFYGGMVWSTRNDGYAVYNSDEDGNVEPDIHIGGGSYIGTTFIVGTDSTSMQDIEVPIDFDTTAFNARFKEELADVQENIRNAVGDYNAATYEFEEILLYTCTIPAILDGAVEAVNNAIAEAKAAGANLPDFELQGITYQNLYMEGIEVPDGAAPDIFTVIYTLGTGTDDITSTTSMRIDYSLYEQDLPEGIEDALNSRRDVWETAIGSISKITIPDITLPALSYDGYIPAGSEIAGIDFDPTSGKYVITYREARPGIFYGSQYAEFPGYNDLYPWVYWYRTSYD